MANRKDIRIKVCGIGNTDNMLQVAKLDIDFIGLDCRKKSDRVMKMVNSLAGLLPDYASFDVSALGDKPERVGVFQDDMPQDIITRVYNYQLNYVQLSGDESVVMIENLKRTLEPDIRSGVKIIKTVFVETAADLCQCAQYANVVDYFLFEGRGDDCCKEDASFSWEVLKDYKENVPFILGGGITKDSVKDLQEFEHPMLFGININLGFEDKEGLKDIDALQTFIDDYRK